MSTEVILHSHLNANGVLTHNVQTTNLGRMTQILRLLRDEGYETMGDIHSERGYHSIHLWSYEDRTYSKVPRSEHTELQRLLKIPVNTLHQHPLIISSSAKLRPLRTRKSVRGLSPRRLSL